MFEEGRMRGTLITVLAASALLLDGCGRERNYDNPQITAQDRQLGAEQHPLILAEFGGAYEAPEARYMAALGGKIAAAAGLEGQCRFTLVNTDIINAFAVPGCYIYITRGLFALVGSEAELASVLGHEVGHIVAEHTERRQKRELFSGLGAALVGWVTGSERLARLAGGAAQFFTLSYSRAQEYESDDLGIRYLVKAGYDPFAAADMLDALGDHDRLEATRIGRDEANAIPAWARTHPLTEERVERAMKQARETGKAPGSLPELEEPYFAEVDGLLYGDDPEQGFVLGRRFAHPDMRISFEAPQGFSLTNTPRAVMIGGPDSVRGEFGGGRMPPDGLEGYASIVLADLLGGSKVQVQPGRTVRTLINGVPAVVVPALVQSPEGQVRVTIAAYAAPGGGAYHFVMLSPPGGEAEQGLAAMFGSFRFLTAAEVASLRPRHIRVVAVAPGDTAESLARHMAYDEHRLERFRALNDLGHGDAPRPGTKVKLVVFSS
jgi:predicted Zn-dependent protease